jgi:hypothetical protein
MRRTFVVNDPCVVNKLIIRNERRVLNKCENLAGTGQKTNHALYTNLLILSEEHLPLVVSTILVSSPTRAICIVLLSSASSTWDLFPLHNRVSPSEIRGDFAQDCRNFVMYAEQGGHVHV